MSAEPVSVTDDCVRASDVKSRNAVLLAEWEAERRRHAEWQANLDPETAAGLDALAAALNGGAASSDEEKRARSLRNFCERSSYHCSSCDHVFDVGDVVYRRRIAMIPDFMAHWELRATCEKCVRDRWHPSWWENRQRPVMCAGGCGVLVSHWYWSQRITTCSKRCSELAEAGRRRVTHEPRRCEVCDEEFTPQRSDARYCSSACRQDAYRKRKLGASPS